MRIHKPEHPETFWCENCDHVLVDSLDPLTGGFYTVSGDVLPLSRAQYGIVMFALCTGCERELAAMLTRE